MNETARQASEPVKSRASDIADLLRDEILLGQYRPGERLPSERDLAARFQVNRGAVREAIKTLAELGIVQVLPGGVRINPIEQASLSVLGPLLDLKGQARPTLMSELVAVFGALLALSSRLALTRATPEEKDRLLTILSPERANSGHANTPTTYEQPLKQFAAALIDINNNLVLRLIGNGLRAQMMGRIDRPFDARSLLNNMANAIEADNPARLAFVISEHFDHLSATLDAGEEPPTNPNASHRTTQHA